MKLSQKLVLLAAVLTLFSMIIGSLSIWGMSNINHDVKDISTNWLPTIKVVGEINGLVNEYRRNELVHILTTDEAVMREYENKIRTLTEKVASKTREYEKLISEPEEKVAFPKFMAAWNAYTANHMKVEELSKQNKTEDAVKLVSGAARTQYLDALQQLQIIIDVNNKGSERSAINAETAYENGKLLSISGSSGFSVGNPCQELAG